MSCLQGADETTWPRLPVRAMSANPDFLHHARCIALCRRLIKGKKNRPKRVGAAQGRRKWIAVETLSELRLSDVCVIEEMARQLRPSSRPGTRRSMLRTAGVAATFLLATIPAANAFPRNDGPPCVVNVLKAEELAYAPMGYWLVRVTLEIVPPRGSVFETTLQDTMPWQGSPPGVARPSACGAIGICIWIL
jgi:hypothetical protein